MKPSAMLLRAFTLEATPDQVALLHELDDFILDKSQQKPAFVLKGYAGTGKTTLISLLVPVLKQLGFKVALLAPTGRAAKVFAGYARKRAYTIHRKIYRQSDIQEGNLRFQRVRNTSSNTVYLVDEASMISDKADFGQKSLLNDLLNYVFEAGTEHNKLLLIGDTAQLPPVSDPQSPALEADYLRRVYGLAVKDFQLTQVMRQGRHSGILWNATRLREQMLEKNPQLQFRTKGYKDFYKMTADRLEDGLRYAYDKYGTEQVIVVCRSNKNANNFNQYIRRMIQFSESEIEAGDLLMIVKNNYFVLTENGRDSFLANGDFVEVLKVRNFEEMYGFRFVTLTLRLLDEPEQEAFEAKVMLDTLYQQEASLPSTQYQSLYEAVLADYQDITRKQQRNEALKKDPYLNALQVKFAYALTCHKSQGGQWKAVFIEQGFLKEEQIDMEFLRWLYTALTRATDEVFLVNFHPQFFDSHEVS